MCLEPPCHIVEARVVRCEKPNLPDNVVYSLFQLKRSVQPNVTMAGVVEELTSSGLVLTVELSSERQCNAPKEQAITGGKTVKRYFVEAKYGETCEKLTPGTVLERRVEPDCCDTQPAHGVPCMLGIEAIRPSPSPGQ